MAWVPSAHLYGSVEYALWMLVDKLTRTIKETKQRDRNPEDKIKDE